MPAGGIPFGHFILSRRLARGGMAEVFLARQRGLEGFDRRVAVKRILPHLSERADFVKMFLDEARLAARLSHPNIVHIYEFGKVDQDYFIAMEYVDGVHAGQLIKRAGEEALPPVLVARIGADAASALAYAHRLEDADGKELHVVHRDISPQNLMISYDGVVKLVDFGIAKAVAGAGEETQPGVVKGKYAYMSPEQTVGKSLDGRSDVFSLALVLWELLAGRHVVDRGSPADAMRAIRDGRFPRIEQVVPSIPAPLATALDHALAVDRDERATAAELGVALEAFIKSSPDLATAMQLAEWIKVRFPRNTTAALPAIPESGDAAKRTRATAMATAASVARPLPTPGSAPAVALPPREATILHTSSVEAVDLDAHADELTTPTGEPAVPPRRAPTHLPDDVTVDDRTALVAPPPPPRAATRRDAGRRGAWAFAIVVVALAAAGLVWAAGFLERAPAARPADASVTIVALPADAAPVDAAPPLDAAPPDAAEVIVTAARLASLDVVTRPAGATVRLAGRDAPRRTTPASFDDLDPGPVTVEVALAGHEPLTRELQLAPGERLRVDLTLTRKKDPPRDDRKPRPGTLNVRTTPYSVVYAGRKKLGETPFVKPLPPGDYTLTFKNPTRPTATRKVTIRAGETTKLNFDL